MSNDMLGGAVRKLVTLQDHVLPVAIDLLGKLSDPEWLEAGKRFLRKENPWPSMPIWRTVWIGRHESPKAMATAIESVGGRLSDWGRDILGRTAFADEFEELELVKASGRELCGDRVATRAEIFAAIKARGGRLCPAEVGPALREQYMDQPRGEWVRIAMEPIVGAGGNPYLFRVEHDDGGRWLSASYGRPSNLWLPEDVWVFLAPRKQ